MANRVGRVKRNHKGIEGTTKKDPLPTNVLRQAALIVAAKWRSSDNPICVPEFEKKVKELIERDRNRTSFNFATSNQARRMLKSGNYYIFRHNNETGKIKECLKIEDIHLRQYGDKYSWIKK